MSKTRKKGRLLALSIHYFNCTERIAEESQCHLPGDKLFIPHKKVKEEPASTGKTHRFQVQLGTNLLRIVLEDFYGKPVANAKCELRVDDEVFQVVSKADGKIEQRIPVTAQHGEIVVKDGDTSLKSVKLKIQIGHLDPVEEVSGQKSRLSNMGYYLGDLDKDDPALFRSSVEEFQCDNGLTVDGDWGPKTQAKLKEIHGC